MEVIAYYVTSLPLGYLDTACALGPIDRNWSFLNYCACVNTTRLLDVFGTLLEIKIKISFENKKKMLNLVLKKCKNYIIDVSVNNVNQEPVFY